MEKAKRKNSPEVAQKRLTKILLALLVFAVIFWRFPITITLPEKFRAYPEISFLIPLLALLFVLNYRRKFDLSRSHLILLALWIAMSCLLLYRIYDIRQLPPHTCGYPTYYNIPYTPFSIYEGKFLYAMYC